MAFRQNNKLKRQQAQLQAMKDEPKVVVEEAVEAPKESDEPQELLLDVLRARVVRVTPGYAKRMLQTMSFELQRSISRHHVAYLLDIMERGQLTDLVISEVEMPDGRRVLVDAYHRLTALIHYGRSLPAVLITYKANSDDELAERYGKIDRPLVRRPIDMLRAAGLERESGLKPKQLKVVSSGAHIAHHNFGGVSFSRQKSLIDRTDETSEWLDEGLLFMAAIEGCSNEVRKLLERAPVCAVALVTFRHQAEAATAFWHTTAMEDSLARDSPQAVLLKWLRSSNVATAKGRAHYSRYVSLAWNAFFQGRRLTILKISDIDDSINIEGTPLGRRSRGVIGAGPLWAGGPSTNNETISDIP